MKKERVFTTPYGFKIQVRHRKSAVFFELAEDSVGRLFRVAFDADTFRELLAHLEIVAEEAWGTLTIKEADTPRNDYRRYHSRKHGNESHLEIRDTDLMLVRPTVESRELYQFNKARMGTFLYDLRRKVQEMEKG